MVILDFTMKRLVFRLGLGFVIASAVYLGYLHQTLRLPSPENEDRQPLRIYAAPFALVPGLTIDQGLLAERLRHLGYRLTADTPSAAGEYQILSGHLDLYLHNDPEHQPGIARVRLVLQDGKLHQVLNLNDGKELQGVSLGPTLISGVSGSSRGQSRIFREWVPLSGLPPHLVNAVVTIEDRRFYRHVGIDPVGVARAISENLWSRQIVQGGSTISQQLAKNLYYSSERTFLRKFREALAAIMLELKYKKDAILEAYLNEIYFGQVGSVGVYGVGEASRIYFSKPVQTLSVPEAALLVGMIKAPNTFSPLKDMHRAKTRRDLVLRTLYEANQLDSNALHVARKSPIQVAATQTRASDAPYFVDYILHEYENLSGGGPPPGTKLYTTLDVEMQRLAEDALSSGLAKIEARYRQLKQSEKQLQGALLALDPKTGAVLAMVGGRDYRQSQFNRAVQAHRQAGSLFKPFVYLAAFEEGALAAPINDSETKGRQSAITPASFIEDAPLSFPAPVATSGPSTWSPQNYDRQFHGEVTVRAALEQSLNIPAIRLTQRIGAGRLARTLHDVGITQPLQEDLSLALGTADVSLLQITGAFAVLAGGGLVAAPTGIRGVTDAAIEWKPPSPPHRVTTAEAAYVVTSLLQGVVSRGTAAHARALGLTTPVAGKTGTTDDHRDAWFIGYTPSLVIGVWVGYDDGESLRLTGAQAALPIWVDFARRVLPKPGQTSAETVLFPVPAGVVTKKIDPRTALLATSSCPETVTEVFIQGTEPVSYCNVHGSFWERMRHAFGF
jgi:1A family penicillin-binding protein